ncbi:uncharacterized protein [Panulirus ornatus]|uniref:uncharacterized protein isoform X2 n=1 Tax=Panulirus ornatus TaxID=150431 RepID=UPI003A83A587
MVHLKLCQAMEFLGKVGVLDAEDLLSRDPLALVNSIIRAFMTYVPYQCVSLLAQAKEERHVPTLEEVVEAGLSLEGGLCFTNNAFFCILLRTLGLDAHMLRGSYSACNFPDNHAMVLVRHLRFHGDEHFVDVGSAQPFSEAVAVSSLPVTFYYAGLESRYCRMGDLVLRLNRRGDNKPSGEQSLMFGEWRQLFHFTLTPVDYDSFRPHMENIYINEKSPFLQFVRAVHFPPAEFLQGNPTTHKGNSILHMDLSSNEKSGSVNRINNKSKASNFSLQTENLVVINEFQAFSDNVLTVVDEMKKAGCNVESTELYGDRILVAIRNQTLLLGPMDAVVKTKVSAEDLANKIKLFFPSIPPAKVDLAVQRVSDHIMSP